MSADSQLAPRPHVVAGATEALEYANAGRNPHYHRYAIESALWDQPYWRMATQEERALARACYDDIAREKQAERLRLARRDAAMLNAL
jgi:hypothetical protein